MKKWKCSVCGYVHTGDEPPEKCPVCGSGIIKFIELIEDISPQPENPEPLKPETTNCQPDSSTIPPEHADSPHPDVLQSLRTNFMKYYEITTRLMIKYHAHPIMVHIPNGVLPVAVLFLLLSMLFQSPGLESAAFYNLVIVVLAMPKVLFTGYNDWKYRFKGNMTHTFLTKMICGAIVLGLGLFLVIWRLMNPMVAMNISSSRWLYLLMHLVILGAAAIAGFLGGKLIRFPGD